MVYYNVDSEVFGQNQTGWVTIEPDRFQNNEINPCFNLREMIADATGGEERDGTRLRGELMAAPPSLGSLENPEIFVSLDPFALVPMCSSLFPQ